MNPRLHATRLLLLPVLALALVSHHVYRESGIWDDILASAGFVLLLAAMGGRIWAGAHLAGRKDQVLVTSGPYSIVRNPLYFFSFIGFLGAGLAFESLVLAGVFAGVFFLTHWPAVRGEEAKLRKLFGDSYEAYSERVALFLPRPRMLNQGATLDLDPRRFSSTLRDCLAIPLVFVVAQAIEAAKLSGLLPILIEIP